MPLLTAIAKGAAWRAPNAASKRSVFGPRVSDPLDSASSIMASAFARSSGAKTIRAAGMGGSERSFMRRGRGDEPPASPRVG